MSNGRLDGVRVCVFDAYGTLFDFNAAARRCRDALGDKAEALSAAWRTRQLQYTWLRALMGRHADFWTVTGEALDVTMVELGIANHALRARLMDCYRRLDAYPEVPALLAALKRARVPAAILSNGAPAMLADAVAAAGIGPDLDAVLSVEDAGVFKPHPSVYALVTAHFGIGPEAVCFLSSNAWDAHGAAVFGFASVWVNRAGAPRENLPGALSGEIATLAALPALLGLGAR
ncbi:MAG: haloacid dehalogenase type II [Alphaproteobacteria bacterium]|nr:haloacid dehalogenase type II [Alphaproteobacteria bacterium]